jgi:hypothetical protein
VWKTTFAWRPEAARRKRLAVRNTLTFVLAAVAAAGGAGSAAAKTSCEAGSPPLAAPPSALWGNLKPGGVMFNATNWTGSEKPNSAYPVSHSVDIENGWIFNAFYGGLSIWDARSNPGSPTRTAIRGGWEGQFTGPFSPTNPYWPYLTEFTQVVWAVDAPAGDDSVIGIGAISPVGFTIWDTTSKTNPVLRYQDATGSNWIWQVYSATIGGRAYSFAAAWQGSLGVHVYDLTAAKALTTECRQGQAACSNVYKGKVGNQQVATKYVHGLGVGSRHFIATGAGYPSREGLKLWDVSTPSAPQLVVAALSNTYVAGVALWTESSRHYLAARVNGEARIYDVTTCIASGCSSLGNPLWSAVVRPWPSSLEWMSVTFSRRGSTPFLYLGDSYPCVQGATAGRHEYLFDVSDPSIPVEAVNPSVTITDQGKLVDYWSWYYSDNTRGWQHMSPRMGKFYGNFFYRAAGTVFDVHEWQGGGGGGGAPNAAFTYAPATVYAGDPITFTDTSTGNVTSREWTFPDGTVGAAAAPAASSAAAPAQPGEDGSPD